MGELEKAVVTHIPEKALTDDLAKDDVVCASGEIASSLQSAIDSYELTEPQLLAAVSLAIGKVRPNDRLFAAIEGESAKVVERERLWNQFNALLSK
ncbi:hypothetical protein [Neptuniibacter sp. QD37_11]|uniref:hypothetical protein n=1 Tax=Neptuniibacter sp. QD37_11 TaxID=3398209 RepID=UPI0039F549C3